jgi:hypothetical protein
MIESKLNPKIREIEYGKREIQVLPMYPLSMADQFKVADLIGNVLQTMDSFAQGVDDMSLFVSFVKEIEKNLTKIISLVADVGMEEAETITNKMTNDQFIIFAEIIWSVNYETSLKNGKSLIEKIRQHWRPIQTEPFPEEPSMRLSPQSLNTMDNTDSIISLNSPIEKEDLPLDKSKPSTNVVENEEIQS